MKTLMLLRHGKSDWDHNVDDHDRPLVKRGIDASQRVGKVLTKLNQVPQRIVSSTAKRALDTVTIAANSGDWQREIETDRSMYETHAEAVMKWIQKQLDSIESVLLVGHQPTWSQLGGALIGGGHLRFPTAALARIDLHIERWEQAEFGCGELVWFELPRVLKGIGYPKS